MGFNKLVILHRDDVYAKDFSAALAMYLNFGCVFIATSLEAAVQIDPDYIVTDNRLLALKFKEKGIHLYDDESDVQDEIFSIPRFQPIRSIASELIEHCAGDMHVKHLSLQEVGDTNFIGVTSGAGGTGTSALAICMGRVLSRLYGKRVLYVSFEPYKARFYAFSFRCAAHCADKLLYHLASKGEHCTLPLNDYLSEDAYGLKCIESGLKSSSFLNVDEEEVYQFLHYIARSGEFEFVILDVPCSFLHYKAIMQMCEKQIMNFGWKKHCYIPSALAKDELCALCDYSTNAVGKRLFEFKPFDDPDSFILTDDGFDIDIHGQFGAEVRALVDRMEI